MKKNLCIILSIVAVSATILLAACGGGGQVPANVTPIPTYTPAPPLATPTVVPTSSYDKGGDTIMEYRWCSVKECVDKKVTGSDLMLGRGNIEVGVGEWMVITYLKPGYRVDPLPDPRHTVIETVSIWKE